MLISLMLVLHLMAMVGVSIRLTCFKVNFIKSSLITLVVVVVIVRGSSVSAFASLCVIE